MAEEFNTYITHIRPDFWRDLCISEGQLRHYKRGDEFLRVGDVGIFIGYIKSGILKYVAYSPDGTEHVIGLEFDGEFVADFPQSIYGYPSKISIVAVSPCDIYCFPTKELARRMQSDTMLREIVMHTTEALFSTVYARYMSLYCLTPQERFDELLKNHPGLFAIFPLKDIASYLNITPTHLSRLRKNVK